jgi:hypothetical protein
MKNRLVLVLSATAVMMAALATFFLVRLGGDSATSAPVAAAGEQHAAAKGPPQTKRGKIVTFADGQLKITARDGATTIIALTSGVPVMEVSTTSMTDIKANSFIGTTAVPADNGTLRALEVHVFDENLRGLGEGHQLLDARKKSTMTNGTVGSVVGSTASFITVAYKDGEKKVHVPANVPIVRVSPGKAEMLKPDANVLVFLKKGPDGSPGAVAVIVGKDGLDPPL